MTVLDGTPLVSLPSSSRSCCETNLLHLKPLLLGTTRTSLKPRLQPIDSKA